MNDVQTLPAVRSRGQSARTDPLVQALLEPAAGRGELRVYYDPNSIPYTPRFDIRFRSPAWHTTGVQPFVWDYHGPLDPGSRREMERRPVLRIAAARHVQCRIHSHYGETPIPSYPLPMYQLWSDRLPRIVVYRPQSDDLIPVPEEGVDPHRIISTPSVVGPDPLKDPNLASLTTVGVEPFETGVVINHAEGAFQVRIQILDHGGPAAFAYQVHDDEGNPLNPLQTLIRIVHSSNVRVTVRVQEAFKPFVVVWTCRVMLTRVPPQGAILSEEIFPFRPKTWDQVIPNRTRLLLTTIVDVGVSMIPVIGSLYDLALLAYGSATGKNFWGYHIGTTELALLGVGVALPVGLRYESLLRTLRSVTRNARISRALHPDALIEIRRVADSAFVEAVGQVPPKDAEGLVRLLLEHLANPRAVSARKVLEQYQEVVGKAYLLALERRLLTAVFTEGFAGFRNPMLDAVYKRYLSQPQFRRDPGRALDPARWAKRQAATKGGPKRLLGRALGEDFVGVINRAQQSGRLPRRLTRADIEKYDRHFAGILEDYGTLRNRAKRLGLPGDQFQIDHVVEQRFWNNKPNLVSAFDVDGSGLAFVVPRNAAVARQIFTRFGGRRIEYVHTVKTRMLKELIPHGAESFFTVQQIWDAHVHTLRSLGVHPSVFGRRLIDDFTLMAQELGQQFTARIPSKDIFRFENGWPRAIRNADGSWSVIPIQSTPLAPLLN